MNVRVAPILIVVLGLGGCASGLDTAQWLTQAAEAHERADDAIAEGDIAGARSALVEVLDPPGSLAIDDDDLRILRQDVYFRLSGLELADSEPERAVFWANEGLTLGTREDIFTANLLVVRGQAKQVIGDDHGAARDFFAAQRINQVLLQRVLEAEETEEQP